VKKRKGLTFIEILLVIIILGILIETALPRFKKSFRSLQLNNFSKELQLFMNYIFQSSIAQGRVITLNIDKEKKEYRAEVKGSAEKLKTFPIPEGIELETEKKEILFYPDGTSDKVTIKITNADSQSVTLTTKGVFGGAKIETKK